MATPTFGLATIAALVLVPLVIWRVYARVRRMIGRQKMKPLRALVTVTLFPILILMLAALAIANPVRLAVLVVGVAAGVLLARVGLARTRFEVTPEGHFYTPNAHIGIAVSTFFLLRIAYRFFEVTHLDPAAARDPVAFAASPLTLGVFGVLAGYYVGYAVGLLRWRHGKGTPG